MSEPDRLALIDELMAAAADGFDPNSRHMTPADHQAVIDRLKAIKRNPTSNHEESQP